MARPEFNSLNLPAGVFDDLTALTTLRLDNNSLSSLQVGVFDGRALTCGPTTP